MGTMSRRDFLRAAAAALSTGALSGCAVAEPANISASTPKAKLEERVANDIPSDPSLDITNITLCAVGDILVHEGVYNSGANSDGTRNYDHIFTHMKDYVSGFDVAMLDQETILGGTSIGELKGFPEFNSPQEFADAEVNAGFDVFLQATNHALDMGFAGIKSDLAYWREHFPETVVTGIADSEEVANTIPIVERSGYKIAILNYTFSTNGIAIPSNAPWCIRMLESYQVQSDFDQARELGADAFIVCPHWGTEYAATPDDYQLKWARRFVDYGATAIIGCHPHVLQPVEWYESSEGKRVPVYWSTGNFTSSQTGKDRMVGGLARLTLTFDEESGCVVSEAGLTPVVNHRSSTKSLSTYRLCDYTSELALQNSIRSDTDCGDFTREWCVNFCAERLGSGFDSNTCEFTLA